MTVKELKRFLRGLDDDIEVYISIVDSNKILQAITLSVDESQDGEEEMYIECDFV